MGQHLASLLLRMDDSGDTAVSDVCCNGDSGGGGSNDKPELEQAAVEESNGNVVVVAVAAIAPKPENLDNDLNLDLDNHNSRFESLYSQPIDGQCNGNFIDQQAAAPPPSQQQQQQLQLEVYNKSSQEANCCNSGGSNASSSSEDGPVNPVMLRRSSKTLSFGKRKVSKQQQQSSSSSSKSGLHHHNNNHHHHPQQCSHVLSSKKKRSNWVLKLSCAAKSKASKNNIDIPGAAGNGAAECVCTGYRRTDEHPMGAGTVFNGSASNAGGSSSSKSAPQSPVLGPLPPSPVIDLSRFNPEEFPMEDCDARARLQRAREMEEGVEPPPGYRPNCPPPPGIQVHPNGITVDSLAALFQAHAGIQAAALTALSQIDSTLISNIERPIHTQVDYVHCLVPDLQAITACSFYWGKMDRYEAERLLEGKQEGTFLLRDSAQEEFLFSVSFRKYGRSLHARIEQWNHKFSFDSHDPGVYASETVCGLIEHYKDPSCCMFFEPMLTIPLHRNFAFPLQHLCRAVITSRCTYDGINKLQLPKTLKTYLKEYHYKQRVRVRRLDTESDLQGADGKSISYLPLM